MKQIPLLQGKALLVETPDWSEYKRIEERHIGCFLVTTSTSGELMVKLPPGYWRIIGVLSEVTEGQAAGIVDDVSFKYPYLFKRKFEDYSCEAENDHDTALESLESAILAENWYFENPYGTNTLYYTDKFTGEKKVRVDWAELQSRVLDRSRCLLLGREG